MYQTSIDFLTGCTCHEFQRCEESKRTLNIPFASRFAEFDTTLKRLRINIWFPLSFELGKMGIFGVTFISGGSRPSDKVGAGVIQTLRKGGERSQKRIFSALRAKKIRGPCPPGLSPGSGTVHCR